ncbi:MAG: hypothetical protein LBU65_17115 [Planctomycetaceae bacterium]|jgi:hypothetical protein|nr:hypothetical protein [Planctomycetaceae bacterium]
MPDGKPLIGLYIGSVIKPKDELRLNKKDISKQGKKDKSVAKKDFPKLPSTIKPPTIEELKSMQAKLEKLSKSNKASSKNLLTQNNKPRKIRDLLNEIVEFLEVVISNLC